MVKQINEVNDFTIGEKVKFLSKTYQKIFSGKIVKFFKQSFILKNGKKKILAMASVKVGGNIYFELSGKSYAYIAIKNLIK